MSVRTTLSINFRGCFLHVLVFHHLFSKPDGTKSNQGSRQWTKIYASLMLLTTWQRAAVTDKKAALGLVVLAFR